MAAALAFARAKCQQLWHCFTHEHEPLEVMDGDRRVIWLGCEDCGTVFWERG